jgi:hypothetical protein
MKEPLDPSAQEALALVVQWEKEGRTPAEIMTFLAALVSSLTGRRALSEEGATSRRRSCRKLHDLLQEIRARGGDLTEQLTLLDYGLYALMEQAQAEEQARKLARN